MDKAAPTNQRAARAPAATQRHLTLQALNCVQRVASGQEGGDKEGYRTWVLNLAPMILQMGLAQTCGFFLAKKESEHLRVLRHLVELMQPASGPVDDAKVKAWFKQLLSEDVVAYRWHTRRALQAATALKRHVQALL